MGSTSTQTLTDFVVDANLETMGEEVVGATVPAIIDSIGVMLAGRGSEAGKAFLKHVGEVSGPAWAVGLPNGADAELAALTNSTFGHALDFDDALPGSGHPSALVLAAILGAASRRGQGLAGQQLAEAFAIGFEVTHRVARAVGVQHYFWGWHTTSTAGSFGTAAAASKIFGQDSHTTAMALGIAASLSSGIQRNFGTMTKPLHSGLAARNGVMAAGLASSGFTASPAVLDGELGFLRLYGGDHNDPSAFDLLGDPYALIEPGTALKKFPCCYATARPIHAMLELRKEHALTGDDVRKISCAVPKGGMQALVYSRPETGLNGKFSLEYVLAAALLDGEIRLNTFTDAAVQRPRVRQIMELVEPKEDPQLRPEDPDARVSSPATGGHIELTVTTSRGEYTTSVSEPPGGPKNPLPWDDIRAKFLDCAEFGGYDTVRAGEVVDQLKDLPHHDDVMPLLEALTAR